MKILSIDQSLSATGYCILDSGKFLLAETISSTGTNASQINNIRVKLKQVIDEHKPDGITVEDYAYGASSRSITVLCEIGGVIKNLLYTEDYLEGRERVIEKQRFLRIQTQSEMKKFCLGNGMVKKDTMYMANFFKNFRDTESVISSDNEADAYMHCYYASAWASVLRKKTKIENFTPVQQATLLSRGVKATKGINEKSSLKLEESKKFELVI